MSKAVFSKAFAQKVRSFAPARQEDIDKAVKRVLVDPDNKQYRRPYLTPYRQEHPSDKTLTLFFEPVAADGVFFVWINDERHPHDTHKNHGDDPCVKEFVRLRDARELESYSKDFHEGKFTVQPRANAPKFLRFEKYGASVHGNVSHDGAVHFSMAIASPDDESDLFDHYKLFIAKTREHFMEQGLPFEFRVFDGNDEFERLLGENIEPGHWAKTRAHGETTYRCI
ncbi:MAG: hypothetical protein JST16_15630 [Bdellovibrionales bacterium]|nr:hypothetical protein [Bdellovibrionales bacterium]